MTEQFADKPTNGYNRDKRLIEYRLDDVDKKLEQIEKTQQAQLIAFAELKTEFRWRAGIFGVLGAGLVVLGKMIVEKLFGG